MEFKYQRDPFCYRNFLILVNPVAKEEQSKIITTTTKNKTNSIFPIKERTHLCSVSEVCGADNNIHFHSRSAVSISTDRPGTSRRAPALPQEHHSGQVPCTSKEDVP